MPASVSGSGAAGFTPFVSHDRAQETPEAKARWWQSLPLADRMDLFVAFTNLILSQHPDIADARDARQASGRIRILRTK